MSARSLERRGLLAASGSVLAALIASACCWLPLLLLSFGASAAGLSARFEALRPWFLGVAAVALAAGFYLTYFREQACAPGSSCATPDPRVRRLNRRLLWLATLFTAGFALFPNYVGLLVAGPPIERAAAAPGSVITLSIEGMTCEACTLNVERELDALPGVLESSVDYDSGLATVRIDPDSGPGPEALAAAVAAAGYEVAPAPPAQD